MDQVHSTTTEGKKGKHLSFEERVIIQTRLKDKWSPNKIAAELGRAPNTIRNEIKRGTVMLYNGRVSRYKATAGQEAYAQNRQNCCRHYELLERPEFVSFVEEQVLGENHWSLDSCVGYAMKNNLFARNQMVCTRTLYNYVDLGLLRIKNIDLPEKLKRAPNKKQCKENKRVLGSSIEERAPEIDERKEFGHWESDLVIGSKSNEDEALLTMIERKTREFWMIPICGKTPEAVMNALKWIHSQYSEHWDDIFKTITTDNGSEFARLSELESLSKTLVYFAHPYSSYEKGSVERHNGLIRRFIPKGKRIDSYSAEQIGRVEVWCNNLPRKILDYRTPDELFEEELDRMYNLAC